MLHMAHSKQKELKPQTFRFVSMVSKRDGRKKKGSTDQKNQNGFFIKMKMKSTSLSAEQKQKFFQQETYNHLFCKGWMDVACFVRGNLNNLRPSQTSDHSETSALLSTLSECGGNNIFHALSFI